ncbi:hypothetical protein C8J56DRAFT_900156 [Mycena floridula]|nr:hypothetical protein C8J56DRAFT_900156 [Mycena floridula]
MTQSTPRPVPPLLFSGRAFMLAVHFSSSGTVPGSGLTGHWLGGSLFKVDFNLWNPSLHLRLTCRCPEVQNWYHIAYIPLVVKVLTMGGQDFDHCVKGTTSGHLDIRHDGSNYPPPHAPPLSRRQRANNTVETQRMFHSRKAAALFFACSKANDVGLYACPHLLRTTHPPLPNIDMRVTMSQSRVGLALTSPIGLVAVWVERKEHGAALVETKSLEDDHWFQLVRNK